VKGWDGLVSSALLGTDRRPVHFEELPEHIQARLGEGSLLDAAALATVYKRAGRKPLRGLEPLPAAPGEDRPLPRPGAVRRLAAMLGGFQTSALGEWLRTDGSSRASLAVADIGQLEIDPDTRVRLVASAAGRHELEMAQGTVHATIWAPPGQFVVQTPGSTAVDLGCAYTLSVDPHGGGTIDVETGWVGFEYQGREAFIPAGARCLTRPKVGPGTPFYADLDPRARAALETIDFGAPDATARREALATIVSAARTADAMTLWHLLSRVPTEERGLVFDALATLVPPPSGVTRDGIRRGDRAMRDRWWDALDLGTSSWWRTWERQWR